MDILISRQDIAARIDAMAQEIAPKLSADCLMVGLLQGGFVFMADLLRALGAHDCHPQTDFLWLSSYGEGRTSGALMQRAPLQRAVKGRQILLVDDVYDTGQSLTYATQYLRDEGAAEVLTCLFARKPKAMHLPAPDFLGFDVADKYLVGYGLDDGGRYRGLADLCAL